jgi:hypothetical protein
LVPFDLPFLKRQQHFEVSISTQYCLEDVFGKRKRRTVSQVFATIHALTQTRDAWEQWDLRTAMLTTMKQETFVLGTTSDHKKSPDQRVVGWRLLR